MKKPSKTYLKNKCDRLFREYILKLRGGDCEMCLKSPHAPQVAHIYSRSLLNLRYDENNVLVLCPGCHFHIHHEPLWFAGWFKSLYPERVRYLRKKRMMIEKIDYYGIIEGLKKGRNGKEKANS